MKSFQRKQIHFLSDFDFILEVKDIDGNDIGWPDFDWKARFYTSTINKTFTASCIGGVCRNCYKDKDSIHIVMDNHGLHPGILRCDFRITKPNKVYNDGIQTIVSVSGLDIELVKEQPLSYDASRTSIELPVLSRKTSYKGPQIVANGVIPLTARPGVIYHNLGQLRICSGTDILRHFEKTDEPMVISLAAFPESLISKIKFGTELYYNNKIGVQTYLFFKYPNITIYKSVVPYIYNSNDDKTNHNMNIRAILDPENIGISQNYVWKNKDGDFKFGSRNHVIEQSLPAPVIKKLTVKRCYENIGEIIADLRKYGLNIEMQYRKSAHWPRSYNQHANGKEHFNIEDHMRGPKWVTFYGKKKKEYNNRRTGSFRVRFVTKKKVSAWTYFYFVQDAVKPFITPL